MKYRMVFFALLAFLSANHLKGQNFNRLKMDSLYNVLSSRNMGMGTMTLVHDGQVVYRRSIGYAYTTNKSSRKADSATRYRIGSISKVFTATMVMQLIEEGKLQLGQTLESFFPDLPNAKLITISNLLNHRSGIHDFTNDADFASWYTKPKTREEMLAIISRNEPEFEPDHQGEYSNPNYILLGYIIEDVTRDDYARELNDRICSRIGLKNTYVGSYPDTSYNESYSYIYAKSWVPVPPGDMSIPGAAGAIVSTSEDLCRFIEALFNGKLVGKASLDKMKTMVDGFGMGLFKYPLDDKISYGHSGKIDGFVNFISYFPQDSLALAYCSNGETYNINEIVAGTVKIYFNKPYRIPVPTVYTYKSEDLDKYIGTYVCNQLPMKITITKDSTTLIAQASGQNPFALDAVEIHRFKYDPAGIRLDFNPDRKEMILRQGGGSFLFMRDR